MRVLLINGSPHQKGCAYTALSEVASALNADCHFPLLEYGSWQHAGRG